MYTKSADSKLRWYWKLLAAIFAAPVALGFLAKLDDRLDFVPIIERIVLNFDRVSKAFWELISSTYNFNISEYHNILTFLTFIATLSFTSFFLRGIGRNSEDLDQVDIDELVDENRMTPYLLEQMVYTIATLIFVTAYLDMFDLNDYIYPYFIAGYVAAQILINAKYLRNVVFNKTLSSIAHLVIGVILIGFLLTFFGLFKDSVYSFYSDPRFQHVQPRLLLYSLFTLTIISAYITLYCSRTITYSGLWCIGIYFLNWVAKDAIPAINMFLTNAGA